MVLDQAGETWLPLKALMPCIVEGVTYSEACNGKLMWTNTDREFKFHGEMNVSSIGLEISNSLSHATKPQEYTRYKPLENMIDDADEAKSYATLCQERIGLIRIHFYLMLSFINLPLYCFEVQYQEPT